ncbi:hypothetical protein EC844_12734 [Acinetobacter calcoaceticus]|uniref:Uncharacterized protein n=1 Tax=Acinetobacter calcoaceticus TaxID=471 RepID=A0A4R1XFE2_ACICA|nr:hypothetical protein EC844_12734 [Acinetobacter calcoaceticus]
MDYYTEFYQRGFEHLISLPEQGLIEFSADLFAGTPAEVGILVYATDQAHLKTQMMPRLEQALTEIDRLVLGLGNLQADLAQIYLYQQRLGLHFYSHEINNEFTAIFKYQQQWQFVGYGDVFEA